MATATAPPTATTAPRPTSQQRWVLALASVASLMVALDALIVSTALGSIRRSLNASLGEVGWTVDAWQKAGFEDVGTKVMSLGGGLVMWGRRLGD